MLEAKRLKDEIRAGAAVGCFDDVKALKKLRREIRRLKVDIEELEEDGEDSTIKQREMKELRDNARNLSCCKDKLQALLVDLAERGFVDAITDDKSLDCVELSCLTLSDFDIHPEPVANSEFSRHTLYRAMLGGESVVIKEYKLSSVSNRNKIKKEVQQLQRVAGPHA